MAIGEGVVFLKACLGSLFTGPLSKSQDAMLKPERRARLSSHLAGAGTEIFGDRYLTLRCNGTLTRAYNIEFETLRVCPTCDVPHDVEYRASFSGVAEFRRRP